MKYQGLKNWDIGWERFDRATGLNAWPCLGRQRQWRSQGWVSARPSHRQGEVSLWGLSGGEPVGAQLCSDMVWLCVCRLLQEVTGAEGLARRWADDREQGRLRDCGLRSQLRFSPVSSCMCPWQRPSVALGLRFSIPNGEKSGHIAEKVTAVWPGWKGTGRAVA